MKTLKLLLLSLLLPLLSFSQQKNKATFIFQDIKHAIDKNGDKRYNEMKISVNNTQLFVKDKSYTVNVKRSGLDTIKIDGYASLGVSKVLTIIAKLKPGENYSINYNPCSDFEIGPLKRNSKARFMRVVLVNNDKNKLYFSSDNCFINMDTLKNVDTSYYYENHISGYCQFATTNAGICTSDPEDRKVKQSCARVYIQFLDAEKYSIIYDCKNPKDEG